MQELDISNVKIDLNIYVHSIPRPAQGILVQDHTSSFDWFACNQTLADNRRLA